MRDVVSGIEAHARATSAQAESNDRVHMLAVYGAFALIAGAGLARSAAAIFGATGLAVASGLALGDARPVHALLIRGAGRARRLRFPVLATLVLALLLAAFGSDLTLPIDEREHATHDGQRDQAAHQATAGAGRDKRASQAVKMVVVQRAISRRTAATRWPGRPAALQCAEQSHI